jgi:SAM-dependent methyltransferase
MKRALRPTVDRLYQRFYPAPPYVDEDELFHREILEQLTPRTRLLDAGAGAGELYSHDYRPHCAEVVGVDLDPRVVTNPILTRGLVGPLESLPLPDDSVDLVVCRYVFEHLADPLRVIREFGRVLTPDGQAIILTPNRLHYVATAASLTPLWFHKTYNRWRGRNAEDTFPTHYRANTRRTLSRLFGQAGFSTEAMIQREMAPNYLTLSPVTFLAGVLYERVVNRSSFLSDWRVLLLARFRKTRTG